jgi:PAS domain S-box-containing protein
MVLMVTHRPPHWLLSRRILSRVPALAVLLVAGYALVHRILNHVKHRLVEEHNLLRTLIEAIPDHIFIKDTESRFVLANTTVVLSLGAATQEEVIGKTDFDFHPPEMAAKYFDDEQRIIHTGQPMINKEQLALNVQAGGPRWLLSTKLPLRDSQGKIIGLVGINRDIAERKMMEEKLATERNLLRTLIDHLPDSIYIKDVQNRFVAANTAAVQSGLGATAEEEIIGKTDFDYFPREMAAKFHDEERRLFQTGQPIVNDEETVIDPRTAESRWRLSTKVPLRDSQGNITGLVGINRDITERKLAEETLATERNLLRTLIDHLPDSVFIKDSQSRFLAANTATIQDLGATSEAEVIGKTDFDFHPPEMAANFYADEQVIIQTGQPMLDKEEMGLRADGSYRWALSTKVPLHDSQGKIIGLVGINRDITERKLAEETLRRAHVELEKRVEERTAALREANKQLQEQIAQRERAETALAAERNLLRTLIDSLPDGIYVKDTQSRFLLVNTAMLTGFGTVPPDTLIGKTDFELHPPELAAQYYADEQEVMRSGIPLIEHEELVVNPRTKELCWVLSNKVPLRDHQGEIAGIVGIARDITERKQIEAELRGSEARNKAILDAIPDLMFRLNREGTFLDFKGAAEDLLVPLERIIGSNVSDIMTPDFVEPTLHYIRQTLDTGIMQVYEYQLPSPDNPQDFEARMVVSGVNEVLAIVRNVTQRKQTEAAEREQRALAEALRDTAATLTSTLDPETVMVRILENVGRVVPHDAANIMRIEGDVARVAYWRNYPPSYQAFLNTFRLPLTTPNLQEMMRTGAPLVISDTGNYSGWVRTPETILVRSTAGAPIRVRDQVIGFLNLDSAQPGFFAPVHAERLQAFADQAAIAIENAELYDQLRRHAATLERRVEQRTRELHQAKEYVEAIIQHSGDAILVVQAHGVIQDTNPAFNRMFGYEAGEAHGRLVTGLVEPGEAVKLDLALQSIARPQAFEHVDIVARRRDGSNFHADFTLSAITGHEAEPSGIVLTVHDITRRRQMELALRETLEREKELSELKSRFIASASHDVRTPLAVIVSAVGVLERYNDQLTAQQKNKHFSQIRAAVKQMTQLLGDVLTFAEAEQGRMAFNPSPLDLEALCRDILEEIRLTAGIHHTLVFNIEGHCPIALFDEKLLRQIITNLLTNAVKYSPENSRVEVDLHCTDDHAVLRIRDEGIGIPEKDLLRLFEPFHRAENVGTTPGAGLGLAITHKAVELHRGTIQVDSKVGIGTTFTVTLPILSGKPC